MSFSLEATVPPHILRDIVKKMNVKTVVRLNLTGSFGNMVASAFGKESLDKYEEALEVEKGPKNENISCCPVATKNTTLLQDVLSDKKRYCDYLEKELGSCFDCCFIDVEYTWSRVEELEKIKDDCKILQEKLFYSNILHNNCFHLKEKVE